jgi:hypothetical protein
LRKAKVYDGTIRVYTGRPPNSAARRKMRRLLSRLKYMNA